MNVLESKQIEMKRVNMISEILSPLKKNIFQDMSNVPIPTYYYNINILKCLYSLDKNDITSNNFYMNIYEMNNEFNQEVLDSFRNLLHTLSISLDITYDILLWLLIEKEKRNFEEHSMITDFIKHSFRTNDARLTSLLRQQGLLSAFELSEMHVMDKIYTKYFSHLVNHS